MDIDQFKKDREAFLQSLKERGAIHDFEIVAQDDDSLVLKIALPPHIPQFTLTEGNLFVSGEHLGEVIIYLPDMDHL